MATRKTAPKNDEQRAMQRYVDQPWQWVDTTPASVKKRQAKGWAALEASLTPAQRRQMGLPPKTSKKK